MDGAVEHVVLTVRITDARQVFLHRCRVDEKMRGLHQEQLGVGKEIAHRALQHIPGRHVVAVQHQNQLAIGLVERVIEITRLGGTIGFARDVIRPPASRAIRLRR